MLILSLLKINLTRFVEEVQIVLQESAALYKLESLKHIAGLQNNDLRRDGVDTVCHEA